MISLDSKLAVVLVILCNLSKCRTLALAGYHELGKTIEQGFRPLRALESVYSIRRGGALSMSFYSTDGESRDNRRKIISGILGSFIGLPIVAELYARSGSLHPISGLDEPSGGWDQVRVATLVFHGAGGQDKYTDELMRQIKSIGYKKGRNFYGAMIDWSKDSQNTLQASFNGQNLGKEIAEKLLSKARNIQKLHLIGISVGSFVADACTMHIKLNSNRSDIYIQLTTLDPFAQRGVLGIGYGNRYFGKYADYSQQYLNTDDPVPSTNKPLLQSACIDVTSLRPEGIFGHDWPLVYYSRSPECGMFVKDKLPRGSVTRATD